MFTGKFLPTLGAIFIVVSVTIVGCHKTYHTVTTTGKGIFLYFLFRKNILVVWRQMITNRNLERNILFSDKYPCTIECGRSSVPQAWMPMLAISWAKSRRRCVGGCPCLQFRGLKVDENEYVGPHVCGTEASTHNNIFSFTRHYIFFVYLWKRLSW